VPPDEPAWWYGDGSRASGVIAAALEPLGWLFGAVTVRRFRRGASYRSRLPVICVGNFTAGGTGKTPLARLVGEHLIASGEQPVFLTRGYRGRIKGPHWVDLASDTAREVGDEPLLLARSAPVVVARDRAAGARLIDGGKRSASVIVMDDGLQNRSLEKDLSIALVDGVRGFGNGRVIPAGPLRAPLDFQIWLVDAIVVSGVVTASNARGDSLHERLQKDFDGPLLAATVAPSGDVQWIKGAPIVAYAGIGHPERFFSLLEALGARLNRRVTFPDHHAFTDGDARELIELARASGASLVTTEKDLARLLGARGELGELRNLSRTLPVRLNLEGGDMKRFTALIDTALGQFRRGQ
jgi:tetraacyldisaccharide 4'-kinase